MGFVLHYHWELSSAARVCTMSRWWAAMTILCPVIAFDPFYGVGEFGGCGDFSEGGELDEGFVVLWQGRF